MIKRESWRLFKVLLAGSGLILILFLAPLVVGLVAGLVLHASHPKTVEVLRYVSAPSFSGLQTGAPAAPQTAAPSARKEPR